MNITVNGKPQNCPPQTRLGQLLETLQLRERRIAVEVNLNIIPRSHYDQHILNEGDAVEIVHAIGGG